MIDEATNSDLIAMAGEIISKEHTSPTSRAVLGEIVYRFGCLDCKLCRGELIYKSEIEDDLHEPDTVSQTLALIVLTLCRRLPEDDAERLRATEYLSMRNLINPMRGEPKASAEEGDVDSWPFEYAGAGYWRAKGVDRGEKAEILHGDAAIRSAVEHCIESS